MSIIKLFERKEIRSYWDEKKQQWYFSVIDVVQVLTDSINPRDYWFKINLRVKTETGLELSTISRQLKMKVKITLFIIVLFCVSCKDENTNLYYGSYSSQTVDIYQTRLFTNKGEIKDTRAINDFISHNTSTKTYFILNIDSLIDVKNQLIVNFLSNNEATFNNRNNSKPFNVIHIGNLIYLESKDTTSFSNSYDQNYGTKPFFYNVISYTPLYAETFPLPPRSEALSLTRTKFCYYIEISDDEFIYPMISFLYVHHITTEDGSTEAFRNYNNSFNENCLQKLGVLDTLAVQQYKVILKKNK